MANTLSRKLPEMLAVRMFFDFKGTHSIILLAVCDARYRFLVVDLWDAGRHSDSRVFSSFPLGKALDSNLLSLPRFLRTRKSSVYYPTGVVDVENSRFRYASRALRSDLVPLHALTVNKITSKCNAKIKKYFRESHKQ